jgi:hypothetical protein
MKKNTEALLGANREIGLEVNMEKTKCMVVSCHQNAGQSHSLVMLINPLEIWQY